MVVSSALSLSLPEVRSWVGGQEMNGSRMLGA